MIDPLEAALRRWERIGPSPQKTTALQGQELSDWLDNEVCRVVAELVRRPDFQLLARWPIVELASGAHSAERALVDTVDAALVEIARRQVGYLTRGSVREAFLRLGAHHQPLPEDAHDVAENKTANLRSLALIEQIASRPWNDLVAEADYFCPVRGLNLKNRDAFLGSDLRHVQIAEFLPMINPQLRRLGDYVSRSLLIRVEYWQSILQHFSMRCDAVFEQAGENAEGLRDDEFRAWTKLRDGYDRLKAACFTGPEAVQRQACISLVQVYAAYRPGAALSWLGPIVKLSGNATGIRDAVEAREDQGKPEQVAVALTDIAEFYRSELDDDFMVTMACQKSALVLVEGPGRRDLFWRGNLVEVDWSKKSALWDLLSSLIEQALRKSGTDKFAGNSRANSPKDARSRLKALLPADLNAHIEPAGDSTYRIKLPVDAMELLRLEQDDRFVPLSP
jgi:hypothetical protein